MLEELVVRIKLLDRATLVRAVTVHLRAIKEEIGPAQVEEHLEITIADPGRATYFAHKGRQSALRKAVEELEALGRATRDELPPIDAAALRTRLRGAPRVVVGLPQLDRALLDNVGERSYVWIQDGAITAIGPEWAVIADACRPYAVARPAWQHTWVELTASDANPWRPPTDAELHARFHTALERTFGADSHHHDYGHRHPLASIRIAVDEWARIDAREVVARLVAAAAGEARPQSAHQLGSTLSDLTERNGALPHAALVPVLLAELASSAGVEIWPTPPGLRFDVIGRAGGGHLRARAVALRGQPAAWTAIVGGDLPRGARLYEGGNLVLALLEP